MSLSNFTLTSPKTSAEFEQYYQLRYQVLRKPWQQPKDSERDELENDAIHKMIYNEKGDVVAVARLHKMQQNVGQVRYMAVDPDYQGLGLGQMLLQALEQNAIDLGLSKMELNAREIALPFYQKQGYQLIRASHTLFDEVKHFLMSKPLLKSTRLAIIGAGWVGKALAQALPRQQFSLLLTATTSAGKAQLQAQGFQACQFKLPDDVLNENINVDTVAKLKQNDSVVICIPPKLKQGQSDYALKIKHLVDIFSQADSQIKHVILLSSTAVYNGLQGDVDESTELNVNASKVKHLQQAEQTLLTSNIDTKVVLRLGGLIGYNRHPGRFFSSGRPVPNPESVVNFIHRDDVVGVITKILALSQAQQLPSKCQIINAVCPDHPKRRDFYQAAMASLQAPAAEFSAQQEQQGKCVQAPILKALGYSFLYPNLSQWLSHYEQ
ncbi:GNAT family N-acetyltransferase [Thalassotalea aquiviva]|uniref:GNAT family N-acetyltransferase n=1 Tax=Thalassotalea aquiviva TaxID=3242415 RepID=UPI003529E1DE